MVADTGEPREVEPKAKVFISYSRKDMAFADRLEAAPKARGFEPLIDRTEIYALEDWWKRIERSASSASTPLGGIRTMRTNVSTFSFSFDVGAP